MHILVLPSWYVSADNSVRGIFFKEQALALQSAGHQVGVLVQPEFRAKRSLIRQNPLKVLRPEYATTVESNLPTYRSLLWNWFPSKQTETKLPLIRKHGLAQYKEYEATHGKPDLIHAHSILFGGWLASVIKNDVDIPVIVTEHSTLYAEKKADSTQISVTAQTIETIDKFTVVSGAVTRAIRSYDIDSDAEEIGNMIDGDFFALPDREENGKLFSFCTIGSTSEYKGSRFLLRAFAETFRGENVMLRIGGISKSNREFTQLANQLGIAAQVDFAGLLNRRGVRQLIQDSRVFISSSYHETFGVALIEALASGKPVIATRSGGPESFVNETNGLLVPVGDGNALASAMRQMVDTYDCYNPLQLRENCLARFGKDVFVERLEQIYRQLL